MNCAEFKEQVAAYAVGALEPHEHAACDRHLVDQAVHDGCYEALHQAKAAATLLALDLAPVAPAPETWTAIEARISGVVPIGARKRSVVSVVPWLVAAAAIAALIWVVRDRDQIALDRTAASGKVTELTAQIDDQTQLRTRCMSELDALSHELGMKREALSLLQRAGTRVIPFAPQKGVNAASVANVLWHAESKRAFVLGTGLAAPTGRDYELWVIRGKNPPVPAGLLHADKTGALVASVDPSLFAAGAPSAFAISLEAQGGSTTQPLGPVVLVGAI